MTTIYKILDAETGYSELHETLEGCRAYIEGQADVIGFKLYDTDNVHPMSEFAGCKDIALALEANKPARVRAICKRWRYSDYMAWEFKISKLEVKP